MDKKDQNSGVSLAALRVPETIDFPAEEEKILAYWKQIDAFKTCLKASKNKPKYVIPNKMYQIIFKIIFIKSKCNFIHIMFFVPLLFILHHSLVLYIF